MALLSEEEKQQLKQIMADYPNNEDLDLTAYIADVIGITGKHVEEGWYNQDINDTHITFYYITDTDANHSDDKNEAEEYYIQVDIWSEEDCFLLKRKIKKLLKKAGFTYFFLASIIYLLYIRTVSPPRRVFESPTRYQFSSISIRTGIHTSLTFTSKQSPQCSPP
mgnify:CR=1 FL=1